MLISRLVLYKNGFYTKPHIFGAPGEQQGIVISTIVHLKMFVQSSVSTTKARTLHQYYTKVLNKGDV